MTNGKLPAYLGWMAYNHKLWASVRYGIGAMTNDIEVVDCFLDKLDYLMMNVLGVCCKIKVGWRKLHSTFGGIGLYNFVTEQLTERLNLLLRHYGAGSLLSDKLETSLAYLQLQLGVKCCPLELVYDEWHYMTPLSWTKMLWRILQATGFEVRLDYERDPLPRERDCLIMDVLREACQGNQEIMMSLTTVRGYLEAIFMSDIVTTDEKFLEQHVTDSGCLLRRRSCYVFPKEEPAQEDWETWISYMKVITNQNFELPTPLGKWKHSTHRKWEWILNERDNILYRRKGGCSEVYMNLNCCWTMEGLSKIEPVGKAASVKFLVLGGSQLDQCAT